MTTSDAHAVGRRIATRRRICRMTQQDLAEAACVSLSLIRKIEQGARRAGDSVLEAIADALTIDPGRLLHDGSRADGRVRDALPLMSAAIAAYDVPTDGPVRPLPELRGSVVDCEGWRLQAQYSRLVRHLPQLLPELARAHAAATDPRETASLLVSAYRSADAVAYKYGALDLSARLIELMRWAADQAESGLLAAHTAYVRSEIFFAARAHTAGLKVLENAIGQASRGRAPDHLAALGALHMRAAVTAARAGTADAASEHLAEARILADQVPEGVYHGTAFGPDTVRCHEISVAVSLGEHHVGAALEAAAAWKPGPELPAERRSGFYIELARIQMWSGLRDDAFRSLQEARRIAPQHVREHPWVRDAAATLRRLDRASADSLTSFAEWVGVV